MPDHHQADEGGQAAVSKRQQLERLLRGRAAAAAVDHPLSYNQRSLWFTYCLAPDSPAYNVAYAFRIVGALDVRALRRVFEGLMSRHAVLRTTYATSQPVQRVHERMAVDFEEHDAFGWPTDQLQAHLVGEAQRPFNLIEGPVWRVRLLKSAADHVLLIVFHHIAYDLWSMMTLLTEIGTLYAAACEGQAAPLAPLSHQYSDFARWQSDMLTTDGERLWTYWHAQLAGELAFLRLETDFPRPAVQSYEGAMHRHELPRRLVNALSALARGEETTLFTILLAAFQLFLHRHSGQPEIVVGSPVAGRSRPEFEHIVGYFLNSLPLRASFAGDPEFRTLLRASRATVHGALDHQDYPFELLVERLKPPRSAGRTPIFQAMFVLNRMHRLEPSQQTAAEGAGSAPRWEKIPLDLAASQFDLSLEVDDLKDGFTTRWEYSTALFREDTIRAWAVQFEQLLEAIVDTPDRRVSEFALARLFIAPRDAAEELVASVFADVLNVGQVSARDGFFALGGDPFKAAQIHAGLADAAGVDIGVPAILELQTVERLAARLGELLLLQSGSA
jgi:hypothetical protein